MTDPKVTKADRERATELYTRLCPKPSSHGWKVPPTMSRCMYCLAAELAKVRQDAYAKMQTACVKACRDACGPHKGLAWTGEETVEAGPFYDPAIRFVDVLESLILDGTNALEEKE